MKRSATLLAAIAGLCTAAPGSAEPADEQGENTIVVTGRTAPPTRDEVYEQARELSRVERFELDEEPLARLGRPLCPGVMGLKRASAEAMIDRIRANAERLDVKLARPNCAANLIVAFVEDGRPVLSKVADARRNSFCTLPEAEQAELLADDTPVRVWNQIAVVGPTAHVANCRWDRPSASHAAMLLPFRKDIVSTLIVFDRDAVADMTVVQLADYATMRGLSHTRPAAGDEAMPTILALFSEDGPPPDELTSFDVGYLRSLYWWVPNTRASGTLLRVRDRARSAAEEARPAEP